MNFGAAPYRERHRPQLADSAAPLLSSTSFSASVTPAVRREAVIGHLRGQAPWGQNVVAEALQHRLDGMDAVFIQAVSEE